jgi:hypothetical protein
LPRDYLSATGGAAARTALDEAAAELAAFEEEALTADTFHAEGSAAGDEPVPRLRSVDGQA